MRTKISQPGLSSEKSSFPGVPTGTLDIIRTNSSIITMIRIPYWEESTLAKLAASRIQTLLMPASTSPLASLSRRRRSSSWSSWPNPAFVSFHLSLDGNQNVKWYRYFFRCNQIFLVPIPLLFWYQIFLIPVLRLFPIPKFTDTGAENFPGTKFFLYRFPYHQKNEQFPVQVPIVNLLNS